MDGDLDSSRSNVTVGKPCWKRPFVASLVKTPLKRPGEGQPGLFFQDGSSKNR